MALHGPTSVARGALAVLLVSLLGVSAPLVGGASGAPYWTNTTHVGFTSCAVAFGTLQGADMCARFDPQAQNQLDFPLDPFVSALVVRIEPRGGTIEADEARAVVAAPLPLRHVEAGPLPLQFTMLVGEEDRWDGWDEADTLRIDVRPNHAADTPQVMFQQRYLVCVSLFYNGAAVPEGHDPCA